MAGCALNWLVVPHWIAVQYGLLCHLHSCQGWKILKFFTRPTSPYVLVNSIINIGNSQNFYSSYSIRHLPWRADEGIFPALAVPHWLAVVVPY